MLIKDFLVVIAVFACFFCIGNHLNTLKTRKNALYCHHKVTSQIFFSLCTWINVVRVILTVSFDPTDNFRIMVLYFLLYGLLTYCSTRINSMVHKIFGYHHSENEEIEQVLQVTYLGVLLLFAGYYLYKRDANWIKLILLIEKQLKNRQLDKGNLLKNIKGNFGLFVISISYLFLIMRIVSNNPNFLRDYLIGIAAYLIFQKLCQTQRHT